MQASSVYTRESKMIIKNTLFVVQILFITSKEEFLFEARQYFPAISHIQEVFG